MFQKLKHFNQYLEEENYGLILDTVYVVVYIQLLACMPIVTCLFNEGLATTLFSLLSAGYA